MSTSKRYFHFDSIFDQLISYEKEDYCSSSGKKSSMPTLEYGKFKYRDSRRMSITCRSKHNSYPCTFNAYISYCSKKSKAVVQSLNSLHSKHCEFSQFRKSVGGENDDTKLNNERLKDIINSIGSSSSLAAAKLTYSTTSTNNTNTNTTTSAIVITTVTVHDSAEDSTDDDAYVFDGEDTVPSTNATTTTNNTSTTNPAIVTTVTFNNTCNTDNNSTDQKLHDLAEDSTHDDSYIYDDAKDTVVTSTTANSPTQNNRNTFIGAAGNSLDNRGLITTVTGIGGATTGNWTTGGGTAGNWSGSGTGAATTNTNVDDNNSFALPPTLSSTLHLPPLLRAVSGGLSSNNTVAR